MIHRIRVFYPLIAANILMGVFLALKFSILPPQIPLFYSRPTGDGQLADTWMILILPILMNILLFLNLFFYRRYFEGNQLVQRIFQYLNLFLVVGFTLIFIKIILVVT